jgi:hypothetical protein
MVDQHLLLLTFLAGNKFYHKFLRQKSEGDSTDSEIQSGKFLSRGYNRPVIDWTEIGKCHLYQPRYNY